jgi:hypothetical protein
VSASRVGPVLGADQARRATSPFVGRQDELDRLRAALARATDGRGGVVELVGEAGIGKSRLVAELLRSSPSVTVLTGAGRPYDATTPYAPFRSLLREALGLGPDADATTTAARLHEVVAAAAPGCCPGCRCWRCRWTWRSRPPARATSSTRSTARRAWRRPSRSC